MGRYPNFESALEGFESELCKASRKYGFGYSLDGAICDGFVNVTIHSLRRPPKEYVIQYDHIKTFSNIRNAITTILGNAGYLNEDQGVLPKIEKVIYNGPATIVKWADGTKTVVKCCEGDVFDPEKGLAMAISKKALGDLKEVNKWAKTYEEPKLIFDFKIPTLTYSVSALAKTFGKLMRRRGEVDEV